MTRRFRRLIFFVFTIFFTITSAIIILFAQGYRLDFETLKIVKTGGIFIRTSIDGAKIYINDEYIGSTNGLLSYSTLISDLAPKKYNVFIYKENYYPWNKVVEIKNGMVVELNDILLFPLELKKIKVVALPEKFSIQGGTASGGKTATSSKDFVSPDKNKDLYIVNNRLWVNYLNDIKREPVKSAGEKEIIAASELPITFFDWFSDSEHLIWLANNELTITELDNRGGKRNSVKFYLNAKLPVFWDRDNSDFYFYERVSGKNIWYKVSFKT